MCPVRAFFIFIYSIIFLIIILHCPERRSFFFVSDSEIKGAVTMEATRRRTQHSANGKSAEKKDEPAQWGRAW